MCVCVCVLISSLVTSSSRVTSSSFSRVFWSVLADTVRWSSLVERSRYYGTRTYLHRSQLGDVITTIIITCDVTSRVTSSSSSSSSSLSRVCVFWSVLADTVRWSSLVERSRYYGTRAFLHRSQLSDGPAVKLMAEVNPTARKGYICNGERSQSEPLTTRP